MLSENKITIEAKTAIDETAICRFFAVIKPAEKDVSFVTQQYDKEACKKHRQTVREDQAEFEDFAYFLADELFK